MMNGKLIGFLTSYEGNLGNSRELFNTYIELVFKRLFYVNPPGKVRELTAPAGGI